MTLRLDGTFAPLVGHRIGTSTTNDQELHLGLDLTVPEVIDLQVEEDSIFFPSFVVDVLLQQVAQGSVLRWEVEETVFAPLIEHSRNLHDE